MYEKPSEAINSELASFYSDLASIDSTSNSGTGDNLQPPGDTPLPAASISEELSGGSDINKKKKRKLKKLQPWRSGNLETWINKWQKAQKELDG